MAHQERVDMDEHQHAALHRDFLRRVHTAIRELNGVKIEAFQDALEREGLLTMALQLPEVRRTLTTVLFNSLTVDPETGEEGLDIDESALIEALTGPEPQLTEDDIDAVDVVLRNPAVKVLDRRLLQVVVQGEPQLDLCDADRLDALTNALTSFLAAVIVRYGGEFGIDMTFQELNRQTRKKIEDMRALGR
jgi:hypothetical protein